MTAPEACRFVFFPSRATRTQRDGAGGLARESRICPSRPATSNRSSTLPSRSAPAAVGEEGVALLVENEVIHPAVVIEVDDLDPGRELARGPASERNARTAE